MIQIQDMFENEKPNIVLKKGKSFHIKELLFKIWISENSFKFEIVVLEMLNKILVIVFTIDFYF